jgi:hypothetical protein
MTIGALVIGKGLAAIDLVRNDRGGAAQSIPEGGAVISLIGQQFFGRRQGLEQRHRGFAVEALAAAQEKAQRVALAINTAWIFVAQPPRLAPGAWSWPLFYPVPNGAL